MARTEKHFRLPRETVDKLEDLVIPGRRTMTDVVIMAVDLLHGRAAHDDAVDLLVDELRALRQGAEQQAETLSAMAEQIRGVATVGERIGSLGLSIDRLGEHQVQLAEALNSRITQPQPATGSGFFRRS
ncbi:hypothetical protein JL101_036370 (plasmid) [Skermanella rosea]|uniref:hypothetical protein n=1 Tax=Skermanella rosea TaxID=1817965 RepID=UPI001931B6A7|nr:hypothetical protein [Skermanella rosea]UEM08219.1 hypothetical protein JL101_036370 [Skermanella rosea]